MKPSRSHAAFLVRIPGSFHLESRYDDFMSEERLSETARREDSPEERLVLRFALGVFGGLFLAMRLNLVLRYEFDLGELPIAIASLLAFLIGVPPIAFAAFSHSTAIRVLVWGLAGAGFGQTVPWPDQDELAVLVPAVVLAVSGFRTVPPKV